MEFVRYYLGPEGMVLPEAFLDGSCTRNGRSAQHLFSCPTVLVANPFKAFPASLAPNPHWYSVLKGDKRSFGLPKHFKTKK